MSGTVVYDGLAKGTVVYNGLAKTTVRVRFGDHGARASIQYRGRVAVAHLSTKRGLDLCMLCGAMCALAGLLSRA